MYWIIDGICFVGGAAAFVVSIVAKKPKWCWIGPAWIAVYPIILEGFVNFFSSFQKKVKYDVDPKSRFVYSPGYNTILGGLEKLHPFDFEKYANVFKRLVERGIVKQSDAIRPEKISRSLLLQKMSKLSLLKACYTISISIYIQMTSFLIVPNFLLRWRLLDTMLIITEGSILAACAAEKWKWAVNLGGGYHHASGNQGGGFCVYPDITLVVHYVRTRLGKKRIMIIDMDAHQGNGHERDLMNDSDAYIVDFYNHDIYPEDEEAKPAIKKDVKITLQTTDEEYLESVLSLEKDMDNFMPQFVIYNAGTDILEGDPQGLLRISADGIIKRDEYVIGLCLKKKVPVVMLLSGGYQKTNAEIIADSIENMVVKFG